MSFKRAFTHQSQVLHHLGDVVHDAVEIQKGEGARDRQIKAQHLQDELLHTKHLWARVSIVCDVHEFSDIWRIDLLVFPTKVKQKKTIFIQKN